MPKAKGERKPSNFKVAAGKKRSTTTTKTRGDNAKAFKPSLATGSDINTTAGKVK